SKTVGAGYVITGLCGDENPLLQFLTKYKSGTDNGMYCDNVKVTRYAEEPPVIEDNTQFSEDFSTAALNTVPQGAFYNRPSSDGIYSADFDVETGVYGKSSTDKSLKIVKNTEYSATTGSVDTFYQSNKGSDYQAGGTIHVTVSFAFSKVERIMNKYLSLRPNSGSYTNERLISLQYGQLKCLGNTASVNWEAGKWYKFDLYITVGSTDNDINSTVTVYMNGNKMFEDIEMTNKSISKVDILRIGQQERVNKYNDVTYIDDYSIGFTPAGETPAYPTAVTLSTSTAGMRIVDTDTILVDDPDTTAAQVLSAISVTGGTGAVVTDIDTPAASNAKATSCYMLVTATDGIKYIYPIVNRVDRYVEDFSTYTYSSNEEIINWTKIATPEGKLEGIRKSVTGLKGKAANDQSLASTQGYVGHNYQNTDNPFPVVGMTTIEYALLLNDPGYSENMGVAITYKDAEGVTKTQFVNLLYYKGNSIEAFTTHNTGNKVGTYEYDRWYKYAIEIDPETFTADIYQNGNKLNKSGRLSFMPSSFDPTDCELLNIYRFKYEHNSGSETDNVYSAIDDIRVYTGKYDAAKDAVNCTVAGGSGYLFNGSWLAITEENDVYTFEDNVEFGNTARFTIFDDDSLTTTEDADDNEIIRHNQYIAAEALGGAIHYYRIVDQSEKTTVISKKVYAGADANNLAEINPYCQLELNKYRVKAIYEKYNNEPEYAYAIIRSNLIDSPNVANDISLAKRELLFGSHEIESDTIDVEDTDEQLKAMLWGEDLSPLGDAFTNSFVKATPTVSQYNALTSPTTNEIKAALRTEHPRLMVTDFEALGELIKTDDTYKKWYRSYKGTANENKHSVEYLAQLYAGYDIPTYEDDDDLRIASSEGFRDRVILLAFNHKMTNLIYSGHSDYYKEKVWDYLEAAMDWPDWGERKQFLDTSDIMMAFAIAYDWLYDDWTEEERATIRNTIKTRGLYCAQQVYEGNSNYSSWLEKNNNWNAWCNAGVLTAALAIAGDGGGSDAHQYTYLARKALESLPNCYDCLGPDGDWQEGTGYGEVAMRFVAIALSSCETALNTDYGHRYVDGLSEIGFYNLYMRGKEAAFGLNDSAGKNILNFNFYFGKLFNDKYLSGIRYYQLQNPDTNPTVFDLLWYDKTNVSTKFRTEKTLDKYYSGIKTTAMRAGGFLDSTTAYAALHAGYNNAPHGHLDGGTFAYETNGVRWAIDLGSDDYNLFNYFQLDENAYQDKYRWCYYRCRAEGHNTWVINPNSGADQAVEGTGSIVKHSFTEDGISYSVANLTNFYPSYAISVKRGIMLNKANGAMIVRDELSLKSSSTLYWFMHTKASIQISGDKKSAILTQDGRRLWVGIIDGSGTFTSMSAEALSTSPNPDEWAENIEKGKTQNSNEGVSKLSIKYTGKSGTLNQTVYMVELEAGQSAPTSIPTVTSLNNWN
ncbi:MAG: heparinase II/III-family protein, partial [Firmicutes bacterium]|nr:heparinase II/III-family protein [Bacillota bacterium]